jgi:MazG family protein
VALTSEGELQLQQLVALGPGDPELIPVASWRALETAGPVHVESDEPLAEWLGQQGIALVEGAAVAAASGERFVRLAKAHPGVACVPSGDALEALLAADAMVALMRLTARLRSECPWDREQTARSIVPHTVEEAYEVAEAAELGDPAKLLDELGDLLFQTCFLALLLRESDDGDWAGVARAVTVKLIRRHPHVFGDAEAESAAVVRQNWEQIKSSQEGREGIFHDVPAVLPALLHARKLQRRASVVGFDWHAWDGAWGDLEEELRELREALDAAPKQRPEREPEAHVVHELGDLLFASVNVARLAGVDPELALRAASGRFRRRVEGAERLAAEAGLEFAALALEQQDLWYRRAKDALEPHD